METPDDESKEVENENSNVTDISEAPAPEEKPEKRKRTPLAELGEAYSDNELTLLKNFQTFKNTRIEEILKHLMWEEGSIQNLTPGYDPAVDNKLVTNQSNLEYLGTLYVESVGLCARLKSRYYKARAREGERLLGSGYNQSSARDYAKDRVIDLFCAWQDAEPLCEKFRTHRADILSRLQILKKQREDIREIELHGGGASG